MVYRIVTFLVVDEEALGVFVGIFSSGSIWSEVSACISNIRQDFGGQNLSGYHLSRHFDASRTHRGVIYTPPPSVLLLCRNYNCTSAALVSVFPFDLFSFADAPTCFTHGKSSR